MQSSHLSFLMLLIAESKLPYQVNPRNLELMLMRCATVMLISLILYAGCLGLSPVYFSENSL